MNALKIIKNIKTKQMFLKVLNFRSIKQCPSIKFQKDPSSGSVKSVRIRNSTQINLLTR